MQQETINLSLQCKAREFISVFGCIGITKYSAIFNAAVRTTRLPNIDRKELILGLTGKPTLSLIFGFCIVKLLL